MHPISILLLLACVTPLPAPSVAVPFQQRGLPVLSKTIDAEGSGYEEGPPAEQPTCPFGCQCNLRVVQCSDLANYMLTTTKCSRVTQTIATQHYLVFTKLQSDYKSSFST
uniref:Biglycan a n=1 Tax=Myripristis murdjan TaxID=586833 RepID=A0A668AFV8_9TELE